MERDRILDHLAVEASPDGQVLAQSNNSGFLALYALAHCRDVPDRWPDSSDYYSDSLLMLAQVAQQCDGQCKA